MPWLFKVPSSKRCCQSIRTIFSMGNLDAWANYAFCRAIKVLNDCVRYPCNMNGHRIWKFTTTRSPNFHISIAPVLFILPNDNFLTALKNVHRPRTKSDEIDRINHVRLYQSMSYNPLFRVRSWNNGLRCMSFYILIKPHGTLHILSQHMFIINSAAHVPWSNGYVFC